MRYATSLRAHDTAPGAGLYLASANALIETIGGAPAEITILADAVPLRAPFRTATEKRYPSPTASDPDGITSVALLRQWPTPASIVEFVSVCPVTSTHLNNPNARRMTNGRTRTLTHSMALGGSKRQAADEWTHSVSGRAVTLLHVHA